MHFGGVRRSGPFIPVNCSAIPAELAESLLFGHLRGAFTGASQNRRGCFELADRGTLFLDEIGDMPLDLQAKLLRVLEDGEITPIGESRPKPVDVRVLAATNADLLDKIAVGTFREELYFRLARFTVEVPPLRDRKEDIPLLVNHFIEIFAAEMGLSGGQMDTQTDSFTRLPTDSPTLSPVALDTLMAYSFPGNVRELKNIIEHALILSGRCEIRPEHLHFINLNLHRNAGTMSYRDASGESEAQEQLMLERAQTDNEERILAYIRQHGRLDNKTCRDLLAVHKRRATYLLNKMHTYGLLQREGKNRWVRYVLNADN